MKWTIQTVDEEWIVEAETHTQALKTAWQDRPPENVGELVSLEPEEGETWYIKGESAVVEAGFEMEGNDEQAS